MRVSEIFRDFKKLGFRGFQGFMVYRGAPIERYLDDVIPNQAWEGVGALNELEGERDSASL